MRLWHHTISLTESQELTALRAFLLSVVPVGVEVIRGQVNRVAEPVGSDFVVFTPIGQPRIGTNYTTYQDNQIVASITGTLLTVTDLVQGTLGAGMTLIDGTVGAILPNTVIGTQVSGSVGGTGVYNVSPSQTISASLLYADIRSDLVPTEWTVQLDIHGPNSSDTTKVIEGLFRSEVGTSFFAATGYDMQPLYCSDPHQTPFLNGEQQYEYRWTMEAHLHVNPVIGTPQQFATEIKIHTVEAGVVYTGP